MPVAPTSSRSGERGSVKARPVDAVGDSAASGRTEAAVRGEEAERLPATGEAVVDASDGVPEAPLPPGAEILGRIRAVGPGVSGRRVGDEARGTPSEGERGSGVVVPVARLGAAPGGTGSAGSAELPGAVDGVWSSIMATVHERLRGVRPRA